MIKWKSSTSLFKRKGEYISRGIIFAGGVLGTVNLLLKLKKSSLTNLSDKVGAGIRTNSESLIGITTFDKNTTFSDGIAISAIAAVPAVDQFNGSRRRRPGPRPCR